MTISGGRDPVATIRDRVTDRDVADNSTLQSIDSLRDPLDTVSAHRDDIDTIVDLGCGHGGFTAALGDVLDASVVYGVDTDASKRSVAESRGLETYDLDLEDEPLPFESETIDLVVCFGLFEHLREYDHLLCEIKRVMGPDGWFWLAVPNLGGWTNRLALLFGYQPRNVEISSEQAVGILPLYEYDGVLGHVHAPTYRGLRALLRYYGYSITTVTPLAPYQDSAIVSAIDGVIGRSPRFARRFSWLCRLRS